MLFFFITSISFILLYKSLPLKPLPPWASEIRLLSLLFTKDLSFFPNAKLLKNSLVGSSNSCPLSSKMSPKKKTFSSKVENLEMMNLLDLPELALECILEKLPPNGLCSMASVCSSLRDRCTSDHFWERHMKQKWDRVVGPAAYREWQWHMASRNRSEFMNGGGKQIGFLKSLYRLWPFSLIRSSFSSDSNRKSYIPIDSIMSCYLALETGKFWFPAQVYNREVLTVTSISAIRKFKIIK